MAGSKALSEKQKLVEATRQFESVMLNMVLKDSLKPMVKGYLDQGGSSNDIYRSMFTQAIADAMSQDKGVGISSVLQAQIKTNNLNDK